MHDIWVDKSYLCQILILPIELIYDLMQTGLAAEILLDKAKAHTQFANQQKQTTSSNSNSGGRDCDDPLAQTEFDKIPKTLAESEGKDHNGHAHQKHVGWTFEQFQRRFADEPGVD